MKTDRERNGLVGPVHKIHAKMVEISKDDSVYLQKPWPSEATTYDISGNKIEEEFYNADGILSFKSAFAYKAGRLVEVISYSGVDNFFGKTEYSYDEQGRLIEESFYDADGEGIRQKSLSYNAAGKRVEDFFFSAGPGDVYEIEGTAYNTAGASLIESIYDADDRLIEVLFYDDNRSPIFKIIMTYDSDGNMVEDAQYTGDAFLKGQAPALTGHLPADIALSRRTHTYDGEKKKIGESIYFANSLKSKREFIYDADGIKTEESEYEADGSLRNQVRFLYEFNSFGDWTKETVLEWSADSNKFEPHLVIDRMLTYY